MKDPAVQDWKAHIVAAQRGDLAAFEQVVRRFEDMAVGYAYSVLGDFQLAEDAAQEAFIQAYLDLRILQEPQAFSAWLRRIVFKQCDRLSRRKRLPTVSLEASGELAASGRTVLEEVQRRETHDEVLAAVSALPENERTATTLFYIDGYSLAEVSEFLEVPVSTVKSRLHTARRQLRERMMGRVEETLRRHAPGEEFRRRVRHVLEGVPRVGFYAGGGDQVPEDVPFPSSLAACLRFMGGEHPYLPIQAHGKSWRLNYATVYIMGTSGLAFGYLWKPGWHGDNADLMHIAADPEEIVRRAFQAVGYGYELIHNRGREAGVAAPGRHIPRDAAMGARDRAHTAGARPAQRFRRLRRLGRSSAQR
jgi:RNA polymerase sigma factor (sigma-70 family)